MAVTASTGFFFRKSLVGLEHPARLDYLLAGSATLKIGDLVRINTSGLLVRAATGDIPAGVLVGLVDQNGINVFSPRAQGTAGATLTPDDQIATASDNATNLTKNLKGQVIIDPAGSCLFFNIADSALAATNLFQTFDVANGNQVTVGSGSDTTSKEVQLISLDPDGDGTTTKGLFRLNNNQFGMAIDKGDTRVAA